MSITVTKELQNVAGKVVKRFLSPCETPLVGSKGLGYMGSSSIKCSTSAVNTVCSLNLNTKISKSNSLLVSLEVKRRCFAAATSTTASDVVIRYGNEVGKHLIPAIVEAKCITATIKKKTNTLLDQF